MAIKAQQIRGFDPDGAGERGKLFGLPFTPDTAEVVILPVPWEVTVSYGSGAALGPRAVLEASPQIDYLLPDIPEAWKIGVAMEAISGHWAERNAALRNRVRPYLKWLEAGNTGMNPGSEHVRLLEEVEAAGAELRDWLARKAGAYLDMGKRVGVLGGDHSSPLGLIQALASRNEAFGILQIDAHADLREAYEGFRFSHASIMTEALRFPEVCRLVQVGVRDLCEAEMGVIENSAGRIRLFSDQALHEARFTGTTWAAQTVAIVDSLPENVYISFDIDGLDPALCPHTGTPVAGGLQMEEALYLIKQVVLSGRELIGFDLCEVAPGNDEWDGTVGARLLYRLASWMGSRTLMKA